MKFSYVLPDPLSYGSLDEFEKDLNFMKQLGYDSVELQITDPADLQEKLLRDSLDKCEYDLVAFQTGATYATRGNCLSSPDKAVRERTKELLKRFIDFAQRFSSIIVFGSLQGRRSDEPDYQKGLAHILEAMEIIGKYATEKKVIIAYEPVNHLETAYHNTIASVKNIIRDFNLPGLRLMIDTFHMNIEETSMVECLYDIRDILVHVHLSETNRDTLGLGHWNTGSFLEKLNEIGYEGCCSMGVYNSKLPRRQCMQKCMEVLKAIKTDNNK
jgi:5-keto-L-gluconate epimerase